MRFGEYLRGRPIQMVSPLPPVELAERINAEADSVFNPIGVGAIGWARFGRLHLRYRDRASYHYAMKPTLAGVIRAERTGSRLILSYRAPFHFFLSVPVVFVMAAFAMWTAGAGQLATTFLLFLAAVLGLQALYAATALREAEPDLAALTEFLEETAEVAA